MNVLQSSIASPLAAALGWTLLHSLWEGAIVAAVLAGLLLVMRSPRLRCAAASIALLVMLGAFAVTLLRMLPGNFPGPALEKHTFQTWTVAPFAPAPARWVFDLKNAVPWLAPFWIAGLLICCARNIAGFASMHRLRTRGVCCASRHWQDLVARLSAQLRVTRPVTLLESALAEVPMVIGWLRPVILIPIGLLTAWPQDQIEAILLHELAHVRRHDYLVNVLQRLVEALLFYHPAVWWISRLIRTERENCCDDIAVSIGGSAREYASALAALETNRWAGREPALAARGGNLVSRIRRLLYPQTSIGAGTPFAAAAILLVTAAVALGGWQSTAQTPDNGGQLADSWKKWLNEDVFYIISYEESTAFLKLTTDAEREKFVEQFWEVRNPTPGSAQNRFKEEHYRRIAYANEHFQTASGTAGWRTDRGRTYILWGPPDEIDSHPVDAFELWTYRHLKGLGDNVSFTFVDRSHRGEYRLAPSSSH